MDPDHFDPDTDMVVSLWYLMSSDSKNYYMKNCTVCAKEQITKAEFMCLENSASIKKDNELIKFQQPI